MRLRVCEGAGIDLGESIIFIKIIYQMKWRQETSFNQGGLGVRSLVEMNAALQGI